MALYPLPIMVEILINGSFTDISQYVYQRDGIQITGGSQDKTPHDKPQPAKCKLTLNNRDGRFSPNNTAGAYYPYLKRNVQIRVSIVGATSSSGNTYTGYRYWGEVTTWPPQSDVSGQDVFVQIEANGPLRRLSTQGGSGSALARFYASLTGSYAPIAYWACEEDPDTTQVQSSLSGGQNMTVTGTPKFKAVSDFNGSAPIGVLNKSTWDGLTGGFSSSGHDVYNTPGTYTWFSPVTAASVTCTAPGATGNNGVPVGGAGTGGGGGEEANEPTLALTIGKGYTFTIVAGGSGLNQTFSGDAVTVTAHPGTVPTGGTGSTNTNHHNGGNGAAGVASTRAGGGGSSGGTSANGNNASGGTGGAAPTGGGKGADAPPGVGAGNVGATPGGGGSGGLASGIVGGTKPGGIGGAGQVIFDYTPSSTATTNVFRFILLVPKHGGNNGKVLARMITGSTKLQTIDVTYVTGGKLRVQGFDNVSAQSFDSGAQSWNVNGQTVMVSVELVNSGANVAWTFKAIKPGNKTLIGSTSGSVTTAAVGNVSEVKVGPNQDITKTAMGHFSVQYALIDLIKVSRALHGHHEELGIHRFIRLLNEEAMGNEPGYKEASDHWGFEAGTQSWVATNGALTNPTTTFTPASDFNFVPINFGGLWPPEGTHSLLLTCNGAGSPSAHSPSGTSGQNILPGDRVSVGGHFYTPTAAANMYIGIQFYTAAGATVGAEQDCTDYASSNNEIFTLTHHAIAPATSAFFAVFWGNHGTLANTTQLFGDDIVVHPKFGPQTRKKVHDFLHEIKRLDQGILRESRKLWGLGYRTRLSLINQSPSVTLDYSQAMLSDPLQPVLDEHNIKNDITVHRHKGSKVRVTLDSGSMSVQEPPAGTGRHRHHLIVVAHADEQLLALANHILNLGTVTDERYPTINVDLGRCGIPGHPLAPLMSAIAGVECGDYVQLTNLASWFPSTTAKQLVIGYTENISTFGWTISWNCAAESPWEITLTNLRRW